MLLGVKIVVATGSWCDLQQSKCQVCQLILVGKNAPICVVLLLHHTFQGCNPSVKQVL